MNNVLPAPKGTFATFMDLGATDPISELVHYPVLAFEKHAPGWKPLVLDYDGLSVLERMQGDWELVCISLNDKYASEEVKEKARIELKRLEARER